MLGFLQRTLPHNLGLKIVSLLLAVGLWIAVSRDPVAEVEMRVPIEFHNLSDNLEVDSASLTQAQIRVRGPERLIHRLQPADIHAAIDLTDVHPGERTFDLTSRQVKLPEDLDVVQVIPGQFHLTFDDRKTRSIEVRPRVMGNFASGLRVARIVADPPSIVITGPRRRVDATDSATTDPIDVSGSVTRASFVTQAYVSDPLIQVVHPTPIRVTVIMEQEKAETPPPVGQGPRP